MADDSSPAAVPTASRPLSPDRSRRGTPLPPRLLLVAAICVALAALLWVGARHLAQQEEAQALAAEARKNQNLVLAHEQQIARTLILLDHALQWGAEAAVREGSRIDLDRILSVTGIDRRFVAGFSIFDAAGNFVARTPDDGAPPINIADRDYFQRHRAEPGTRQSLGVPIKGRYTGRWIVPLTRRIDNPDGSFRGIVFLGLDPAFFTTLYENTDLGSQGAMALIGTDGITRVRRNGSVVSFGEDIRKSRLFVELPKSPAGWYIGVAASDGTRRLAAYRVIEGHPLIVLVASSVDEMMQPLEARRRLYQMAAAAGTLLLLLVAGLVVHQARRDRVSLDRLALSENRYRLIFENNLDGVARMRPDGSVIEANAAAKAIFRLDIDEIRRRGRDGLTDPSDPRIAAMRAERERTGRSTDVVRGLRGDGSPFDLEVASQDYIDEDGQACVLLVLRDVSERRRLETAQQLLRDILDASPDFIGSATLDRRITFLNRAALRMVTPASGEPPRSIEQCHPERVWRTLADEALPAVLRDGTWTGESAILLADGSEMPVLQTVVCHRDARGDVTQISTLAKDITPLRQAEAARRAREVAEQSSRAKSEFMSRMSHELRTPLNAILGFSELLQTAEPGDIAPLQRVQVDHIQRAGQHLLALIDDLLDISRMEVGAVRVDLQPVDAMALVRDVLAGCAAAARERQVRLEVDSPDAPCWVRGDPTRVRQIVSNLVANGIAYGRRGGTVRITALRADDRTCLSVVDDGPGLAPEQVAKLFTAFERLGRESSDARGTGIGLVISRRLAELMSGTLTAESRPGVGSTFTLELPSALPGMEAAARDVPAAGAGLGLPPCRLLYIDDDEVNREVLRGMLAGRPGVQLELAADAMAGLRMAVAARPDVILADIRMPGMSGFEFLAALRADPALRVTPCVAVSAHAMGSEIRAATEAGFDGYLTKPVRMAALYAEIRRHLPA